MFKILKDLEEFNSSKQRFYEYKKAELDYMEYQSHKEDIQHYLKNKSEIDNYLKELNSYILNKESFLTFKDHVEDYLKYEESFKQYAEAVGNDRPFFLMYAADIDPEGNVTFKYDFDDSFIKLLRNQGITGIDDIEIIEIFLYNIMKINYYQNMIDKSNKEAKKELEDGDAL